MGDAAWDYDTFRVGFPADVEREFGAAYGEEGWSRIKHALATPYVLCIRGNCCFHLHN